jgi:tRNA(adenine34) deaminase
MGATIGEPPSDDARWMAAALAEAARAEAAGEVPIGAVIVHSGQLVAAAGNAPITRADPTAHAEVVVIRDAARALANYRLAGCTLYVTVEPCAMCVGAALHARLDALVYGCTDPKAGAAGSRYALAADGWNHRLAVRGGVLADDCARVLREFFARRRK